MVIFNLGLQSSSGHSQ